eukprot:1451313-Pyramimonas_sp.AAC.1
MAGRTRSLCLKDLGNVFGSSSLIPCQSQSTCTPRTRMPPLCTQRFENAHVALPSNAGGVVVRPRQGGVMGDPFMVRMFIASFKRLVAGWSYDLLRWDNLAKDLIASWGPLRVNLSLLKFADDLNQSALAGVGSSLWEFMATLRSVDESLGVRLAPFGCGQKAST